MPKAVSDLVTMRRPVVHERDVVSEAVLAHLIVRTIANKRRPEELDRALREERFAELARMADDPVKHKAFLRRASLLESVRRLK